MAGAGFPSSFDALTVTNLTVTGMATLPVTTAAGVGVVMKGADRFLHDFQGVVVGSGGNTFLGVDSGNFTLSRGGGGAGLASYNTGLGHETLTSLTTGYNNSAIGQGALYALTTGHDNMAVGFAALTSATTDFENVAIGTSALTSLNGSVLGGNIGIGASALLALTTGHANTAIGYRANIAGTTSSANTSIGWKSLEANVTGDDNTAIGTYALRTATLSQRNTAVGVNALQALQTGTDCVALGWNAGYYETGSNKLFIDNAPRASEADGRAKALVYGIFDPAVANQRFFINGVLGLVGTSGAAAQVGTVTNAPTAGNPADFIPVLFNGNVRYIPAWA